MALNTKRFVNVVAALALSFGVSTATLLPKPTQAAEKIYITFGPFGTSLPVKSLETFAETGTIDRDFQFFARNLDANALAQLRAVLRRRFKINSVAFNQLAYTRMGEDGLKSLGLIIKTETGDNGAIALRGAMTLAANDPQGFSSVSLLQQYPSRSVQIDAQQLLKLQQYLTTVIDYRDTSVVAIQEQAKREADAEKPPNFSQMEVLWKPGKLTYRKLTFTVPSFGYVLPPATQAPVRNFPLDVYLPQSTKPLPIVVLSHGLGSRREDLAFLAEHLASHGFVAVVPEHLGSNKGAQTALAEGLLYSDPNQTEFVDRPQDIQQSLDFLTSRAKTDPNLRNRLNFNAIGMFGHSFGGYTTLAIAGAEFNLQRLSQICKIDRVYVNPSVFLQCSADGLPTTGYRLRDPRIKAAIAINPVAGEVFDSKGVSKIQIPMMLISGTNDFVAPASTEQIHPFLWLTSKQKYLVTMQPASHNSFYPPQKNSPPLSALGQLLQGPDPVLGSQYIKALSVAMMQVHLNNRVDYAPYLTASYAQFLSQNPLELRMVRSLTAEQLEAAFGKKPPIPIFP